MSFLDDLAAAKAAVEAEAQPKSPVLPIVVNKKLYEMVFYKASTEVWSRATVKNPPRTDVPLDITNGYNISGAARDISPECGRVIDDGVEITLKAEDWAGIWKVIEPAAARKIEAHVWTLHELEAEKGIQTAKKASKPRPVSRKKSG